VPVLGEAAPGLEASESVAVRGHGTFGSRTAEPSAVPAAYVPAPAVSTTAVTATDAPRETTTRTVTTLSSVAMSPGFTHEAPRDLGQRSTATTAVTEPHATPALPFVPSRSYDAPTPSLENVTHVTNRATENLITEELETEKLVPAAPTQPTSSRAVLAQALSAVQSWMSAPEAPAVHEIARAIEPLKERANATFLPAPQFLSAPVSTVNRAPAMLPVEARGTAAIPLLESAPRLSIGRIEIEIVRPQITAPTPRPIPTTRAPARAPAPLAPAAPRSSALDAKRNFGMRQR
jgi:hypothetical protein